MIAQAVLDALWDFDDAAGSEARFRSALDAPLQSPLDSIDRDVLRTQLARAIGLQSRFDEAAALLIEIESNDAGVGVRVLLESGRIMNASGHADVAASLFRQAAAIATTTSTTTTDASLLFLRIDALHMLAIVDAEGAERHTAEAVLLASESADARTRRWLVNLHSNIGWRRLEGGAAASALESFTEASRQADLVGTTQQQNWSAAALDDCRTLLGSVGAEEGRGGTG